MKIQNPLRKIIPMALLLALIVIVAVSCRKNEPDINSVPPGPNPPPATPDVFSNKPLHLLSEYEIANHNTFPGHLVNRLGNGLVGGEEGLLDPFKEIASSLLDVYNGRSTDEEYASINAGLSQIQQQIDTLQKAISNLSSEIGIEQSELSNLYITTTLNQYIGLVQGAMDSTVITGLQYYPRRAAQYKAGHLSQVEFQSDTSNLPLFAYSIEHNTAGMDVTNWSLQLNYLLCPPGGPSGLLPLTDLIIQSMTQANLQDSASVMKAYMVLESYFMQVVNSQFQCATLQANAYVYYNPADTLAPSDWFTDNFTPQIKAEITGFLSAVDHLFINLDYRNQNRFVHDMQYARAGLAPDDICIQGLARSQFIANLLYDAMGLPYPVVCGHIITPVTYGSIGTAALSVNIGGVTKSTTPVQLPSQIPYTYWVAGNPAVSYPDNQWYVYRYGTLGQSDGSWTSSAQSLEVAGTISAVPWVHYVPMKGNITPLWYNPQNPSQTSTTQTSACTFQFAYFSANWQWGFLQLTNSQIQPGWYKTTYDPNILLTGVFDFTSFNTHLDENQVAVPCAGRSNGSGALSLETAGINWTNPDGTAGTMQLSGNTSSTSNYYVIVDGNYTNVKTSSTLPPGGSIKAWAWYKANYNMKGSGGDDLTVNIGLTRPYTEWPYPCDYQYTIGSELVRTNWHDQAGSTIWNSGFGDAKLAANTTYQPGIQYYYQTANLPGVVPASITLISDYQFVYGGLYPLPSK